MFYFMGSSFWRAKPSFFSMQRLRLGAAAEPCPDDGRTKRNWPGDVLKKNWPGDVLKKNWPGDVLKKLDGAGDVASRKTGGLPGNRLADARRLAKKLESR